MTRSIPFAVIAIVCLSWALTGFSLEQQPEASPSLKYGVRRDPVIIRSGRDIGPDRLEADRPGLLPLMRLEDFANPRHPYYANRAKLTDDVLRDPNKLTAKDRAELESMLDALFGTPAKPLVKLKAAGLEENKSLDVLKVDAETLSQGSKLYRLHCTHCHGESGDGRGPTARWVNPHPRDFRAGLFKFQSVDRTQDGTSQLPPSRLDLLRTLRHGIEGTAMPSFDHLKDEELDSLVSYAIHLSLRGNVELDLLKNHFKQKGGALQFINVLGEEKLPELGKLYAQFVAEGWVEAQSPANAIKVAKYPYDPSDMNELAASVKRGQQIYMAKISEEFKKAHALKVATRALLAKKQDAQKLTAAELAEAEKIAYTPESLILAENKLKGAYCIGCHTLIGRDEPYRFDVWGTLSAPGSATRGVFRGGKRPVDIYYRIHSGINGFPMTGIGVPTVFKGHEEYIWDLVNFVLIAPDAVLRKKLGIQLE